MINLFQLQTLSKQKTKKRMKMKALIPPGRAAKSSKGKGEKEYKRVSEESSNTAPFISSSTLVSQRLVLLRANVEGERALFFAAANIGWEEGMEQGRQGEIEGDDWALKQQGKPITTAIFKSLNLELDRTWRDGDGDGRERQRDGHDSMFLAFKFALSFFGTWFQHSPNHLPPFCLFFTPSVPH